MSNEVAKTKKSKLPLILTLSYIVLVVGTFLATKKYSSQSVVYLYRDQQMPETKAVARINGEDLTEVQLVGDNFEGWIASKQRDFDYKMNRLQEYVFNKFSMSEAEKAGVSHGEFLKTKVFEEPIEVNDAEILALIEERKLPGDSINIPAEKEKLKNQVLGNKRKLKKERFVAKVIAENKIEVFFPRPVKLKDYLRTDGIQLDGSDGSNKLVLFFNFNNGGHLKTLSTFRDLHAKYKDKIRFVIKHHSDSKRPETFLFAHAATCANKLGTFADYFELSEKILKLGGRAPKTLPDMIALYTKNPQGFEECLKSEAVMKQLRSEQEQSKQLSNNPNIMCFLNGKRLNLGKKPEDLEKDIEGVLTQTN
jgi:hypothetical protein